MELNEGYKQTEVGVIPIDWDERRLDQICFMKSGITITSESIYDGGKYPCYGGNGLRGYTGQYTHNGEYALIGRQGALCGNVLGVRGKFFASEHAIVVTSFIDTSIEWLTYQLIKLNLNRLSESSAQPGLSVNKILSLKVPLPPTKTEQIAIAQALTDFDVLIARLEKLIIKKRLIKQGAMQKLLDPFDENRKLKSGWVEKRLGDTAVLKARIGWQGLTTAEYKTSGDYCLITGTEFKDGFIDWDKCFFVEYERYKQDRNIQVKQFDVLVTKDGTIGKVAFIRDVPKPATLNSGVFVIRPIDDAFDPEFFFYVLKSNIFSEFLAQLSAGSTINHLYQKDFVHFKYYVPSDNQVQKELAKIFSDMDKDIDHLTIKLSKIKQLKQGMMQSLLTGKIRLVEKQRSKP